MIRKQIKIIASVYAMAMAGVAVACYGHIISTTTLPTTATCNSGVCTAGPNTPAQCGSNIDPSGNKNCTPGNTNMNFPNFVCPPSGTGQCTYTTTISTPEPTATGSGNCGNGGNN
jgi:hypothetical protein